MSAIAFFPEIDEATWRMTSSVEHPASAETPFYAFEVWERRGA